MLLQNHIDKHIIDMGNRCPKIRKKKDYEESKQKITINFGSNITMQASLKEKTELTFQKVMKMKISVIHMSEEDLFQYLKGLKLYKKQEQGHIQGIQYELRFKRKYERRYTRKQKEPEGIFTKLKRFFAFNTKESEEEQQQTTQETQTNKKTDKNGYLALPAEEIQPKKCASTTSHNQEENFPEIAETHKSISQKKAA